MDYTYIHMVLKESKPRTKVWEVRASNGNVLLGEVRWFARWRQYCFFPEKDTVFSSGCMDDIRSFIQSEMDARRS